MKLARWLPTGAAVVLVAGAVTVPVALANATPDLPHKTAAQILVLAANGEKVTALSGDVQQVSNLGLPDLSSLTSSSASSTTAAASASTSTAAATSDTTVSSLTDTLGILSSDQRGHVAVSDAGVRLQRYTDDGEYDLVANSSDVWLWDSSANKATDVKLPTLDAAMQKKLQTKLDAIQDQVDRTTYTPQQVAENLLDAIDDHTRVTVGENRYVAGQATYTLVLTPKEKASLVANIKINIDSVTGLPLQVSVYGKNSGEPAYQLGYTSLSYTAPAASTFSFTPPADAKVITKDYSTKTLTLPEKKTGAPEKLDKVKAQHKLDALTKTLLGNKDLKAAADDITVSGSGWATTVTVAASDETRALLQNKTLLALTAKESNGDRVVSTALLNIVFHVDGSISAGSVSLDHL